MKTQQDHFTLNITVREASATEDLDRPSYDVIETPF